MPQPNLVNTRFHADEASILVRDLVLPDGFIEEVEPKWGPQFAEALKNGERSTSTLDRGVALNDFCMPSPSYHALIGVPSSRARLRVVTSDGMTDPILNHAFIELNNRQNDITSQIQISNIAGNLEYGLCQVHSDGRPAEYQPTDEDGLPEMLPLDQPLADKLLNDLLVQAGDLGPKNTERSLAKLQRLIDLAAKQQTTQQGLFEWEAEHATRMSARIQRTIRRVGPVALAELDFDLRAVQTLPAKVGQLVSSLEFVCGGVTCAPHARLSVGIKNTSKEKFPIDERREIFAGIEAMLGTKSGIKKTLNETSRLLTNPSKGDPTVSIKAHDYPRFQDSELNP